MFSQMKLKQKLLILFLLVGIIPFVVIGLISLNQESTALERQSFNQLEAVRGIKEAQIQRFFAERHGDMNVLTETVETLRADAFQRLEGIRNLKRDQVERYFKIIQGQILTFSTNQMVVDTMRDLSTAYDEAVAALSTEQPPKIDGSLRDYYQNQFAPEYKQQNGKEIQVDALLSPLSAETRLMQSRYISNNPHPLGNKHLLDGAEDGTAYSAQHAAVHPIFRSYMEEFGYYDIFLADPVDGTIIYSVFKELDYATSLKHGPYAESGIGQAWKEAMALPQGKFAQIDFDRYGPSYDAPAGFISTPVFDQGERIGVLIFQMPVDRIIDIMSDTSGLGETGETILVGPDYLMRSDSRLEKQYHTLRNSFANPDKGKVDTRATRSAIEQNQPGTAVVTDYRKERTLISWVPVEVAPGIRYSLSAKMDIAEAFIPHLKGEEKDFYQKYVEEYGYYDLFLINPDGYIFYTAAKESDYQTNILNGKYSDSNLGQLVRQVLESKDYGIVDFAPYAPSNGDPAAFIAKAMVHDGKVDMVVALQLPLDGINAIMTHREGMGESGETYLVGQDLLMRSDSYLDPVNHTVISSFRNPELGKVDTAAAHAALAGERDSKIIIDYNGNPVLSAYTPLQVGEVNWALLAEIDESEAFAAVNSLRNLMVLVGIVGLIAIVAVGWLLARSIATPVMKVTQLFSQLEQSGDFSMRCVDVTSKDEIGEMAEKVNSLLASLQQAISNANQVVTNVARGNFDQRMEGDYRGDLVTLKEGVNGSADSVENTMRALGEVMSGLSRGDLSVRMSDDVEQQFRDQVNGAMTSIDEVLQQVAEIIQQLSEGNFSARMTYEAQGDLKRLSDNINRAMGDLDSAVTEVVDTANSMGKGDLTQSIRGSYRGSLGELKDAINTTQQSITSIVSQVRTAANNVKVGSTEVSQGSHDLSTRTSEQAASLEETAASMEEMSSTVNMNADSASQASQLAEESVLRATEGADVVANAVQAMEGINESSNKISEIIAMIDGIAFQTNLLALNAAVEAARAGEHGRGFAVVAGEVRTLAQRSADAAKDIKTLIEDSSTRIQEGSELVNHSGDALNEIQESVKKLNDISAEISAAAKEQTQGIEQVNGVITQLDTVTQENAALVEESAASSSRLLEQANELSKMVSLFKVKGAAAEEMPSQPASPSVPPKEPVSEKPAVQVASSNSRGSSSDEWSDF